MSRHSQMPYFCVLSLDVGYRFRFPVFRQTLFPQNICVFCLLNVQYSQIMYIGWFFRLPFETITCFFSSVIRLLVPPHMTWRRTWCRHQTVASDTASYVCQRSEGWCRTVRWSRWRKLTQGKAESGSSFRTTTAPKNCRSSNSHRLWI